MGIDYDRVITIDFETEPIAKRPEYPPKPVGVAIKWGPDRGHYYAWGHPTGNNATEIEAGQELANAYNSGFPLLFHNCRFDLDVCETHFGLETPWDRVHDTEPLLFLRDPYAPTYSLKPSAESILGDAPEERDAVIDWLIEHQPVEGKRLGKAKGKNYAGAWVCKVPGDLAGEYAVGDVDRTYDLWLKVAPEIQARGMWEAYERERALWPVLLGMERHGVRVDWELLNEDVEKYLAVMTALDVWIRNRLGVLQLDRLGRHYLNIDSGRQLAAAIQEAGLADLSAWPRTKKSGELSTAVAVIDEVLTDRQLAAALRYRSAVVKSLNTFMEPWLATANRSGGRIFTAWHSTRHDHGSGVNGARTGRLSSSPNFQNASNKYRPMWRSEETPDLPEMPFELPPPPLVRSYLLPEEGHVFIGRDYSQQEPRMLAHFEPGPLEQQYQADPWTDLHSFATGLLEHALPGRVVTRKEAKTVGLGLMYGMGVGKLAENTGLTVNEAKRLKAAYLNAVPELRGIYQETKIRAQLKEPIRTWGGREYYCEPPKKIDGVLRSFEYKMPNSLIQGSGSDVTKTATIQFARAKKETWHISLLIHDEIIASVPVAEAAEAMEVLRVSMETINVDVPLVTEGKVGGNFQEMRDYDKKGKVL